MFTKPVVMKRRVSMKLAAILLCLVAPSSLSTMKAQAQESPSSEKAALIKELVQLTGARADAEAVMNSMASHLQQQRERMLEQALSNVDFLSEKEREDFMRKQKEDSSRLHERVMKLFKERIDLNKIIDEVSDELFDKYYTADELKDLIAFYKSPTGQKAIRLMPQIFADSMAKTSEKLTPQLGPIINQVMEEEKRRIEEMLPPKPQPKRVKRGRRRTA